MKIGIVGNGFVGQATALIHNHDIIIYDIIPEKCIPLHTTINDIINCDIIFICVPTPMYENGSCCLDYVYNVVNQLDDVKDKIVLRSTVPVGTSDNLNICFMPEFLTEKNWKDDVLNEKNVIFGCNENKTIKQKIKTIFPNKIFHFVSTQEAELCKLTRNAFLATKVSFFNEINEFCQNKKINYQNVQQLVALDNRIGLSHTSVPGYDGHFGFGGICLPKDTESLVKQFQENNTHSIILDAVLHRNKTIDRPEQDWKADKGRAFI